MRLRVATSLAAFLMAFVVLAGAVLASTSEDRSKEDVMPDSTAHGGYLAVPPSGKGPGVLVLHAWWGLNDTIRDFCERLAGEGYTAFAPDLYHGGVATTIEEAEALSGEFWTSRERRQRAQADITRAVGFLSEQADPEVDGIAVIGFSLGAFFALWLSEDAPERVGAVVVFYGTRPGHYEASSAAFLGHFAASDEFEPASEVEALQKALRDAGRPVEFHTYEGTGHWFFEPDRTDAYNEEAARLAWERTVAFLRSWKIGQSSPHGGRD